MKFFVYFSVGVALSTALCADEAAKAKKVKQWMSVIERQPFQCLSLHEAAYYGDLEVAKLSIKEGQSPNMRDELGNTPLHIAMKRGKADVVALLLENGADIMLPNAAGESPVSLTTDGSIVKLSEIFMKRREQQLAAIKAMQAGDVAPLKNYLYRGGEANFYDAEGRNPVLFLALVSGNSEAAQHLIKSGADLKPLFDGGKSYLMIAAGGGADADTIELLLDKGADPFHQAGNGATALHDAVWAMKNDSVKALLPAYKSVNYSPDGRQNGFPMYLAVGRGNLKAVELMLEAGLDINVAPYKDIILGEAVKRGNIGIVKALLKAGADPTAKAPDGKTPIEHANGPIAEVLKQAAAK